MDSHLLNKSVISVLDRFKSYVLEKQDESGGDSSLSFLYQNLIDAINMGNFHNLIDIIETSCEGNVGPAPRLMLYSALRKFFLQSKLDLLLLAPPPEKEYNKNTCIKSEEQKLPDVCLILKQISEHYLLSDILISFKYSSQWSIQSSAIQMHQFIHFVYPLTVHAGSLYYISSGRSNIACMNLESKEISPLVNIEGNNNEAKCVIWKHILFIFRTINKTDTNYDIHIACYSLDSHELLCKYKLPSNASIHEMHILEHNFNILFLSKSFNTCVSVPISQVLETGNHLDLEIKLDCGTGLSFHTNPMVFNLYKNIFVVFDAYDLWSDWQVYEISDNDKSESFNVSHITDSGQGRDGSSFSFTCKKFTLLKSQVLIPVPHKRNRSEYNSIENYISQAMFNMPATVHGFLPINNGKQLLLLASSYTHDNQQLYICDLSIAFTVKTKYCPVVLEAVHTNIPFATDNIYSLLNSADEYSKYIVESKFDSDHLKTFPTKMYQINISSNIFDNNKLLETNYSDYIEFSAILSPNLH